MTTCAIAQGVGINGNGNPADQSSILDASATDKGMLIPRLSSTQRDAIASPAEGLMIFNTDTKCFNVFKNLGWYEWCGTCIAPNAPVAGNNGPVCPGSLLSLSASPVPNATYNWSGPDSFASSEQNPTVSLNASSSMNGTYSVTVTTVNGCVSSPGSTEVTVHSLPSAPGEGVHSSTYNSINWNWNAVSGAMGYKWSLTNNYLSATDNGTSTTYTQSGLTCASSYTLYIWAYTSCGSSTATTLSNSTASCPCPEGTGGSISHAGGKTIHTFTSSGTFTAGCSGNVEVLVVAGGAGGGGGFSGAGGAGGVIYQSSYAVNTSPVTVTVGAGGAGGINEGGYGGDGGNSVFATLTAFGGGSGGAGSGHPGGSGGGGGTDSGATIGGSGTSGQGNAGGGTPGSGNSYGSGGGGGADGSGAPGNGPVAGNGGAGAQYSISGSPVYYASGGGGSTYGGGTYGISPPGGGSNGCTALSDSSCTASSAMPNTGGGGGAGGGYSGIGGNGGSGIVIVSYPTP